MIDPTSDDEGAQMPNLKRGRSEGPNPMEHDGDGDCELTVAPLRAKCNVLPSGPGTTLGDDDDLQIVGDTGGHVRKISAF